LVQTGAHALSASGSLFVPGKPLTADQPLFERDDGLREISNRSRSSQFGSFNLVGERRIGKTSLLNHLAGRATTYLPAAAGQPPFVVIRLNLQDGITNEAQFYGALMREAVAQLPAFAASLEPEPSAAACQQLLQRIKSQQAARVVVLVDEFECIFDEPQAYAQPAFCNSLRSLCEDNRLALIVATREPLLRYFEQQRLTSTLPSYLTPIHLKELSPEAADQLLTQPSDRPLDNRQVRHARAWAGTHPCRLQCAADALYWSQVNSEPMRGPKRGTIKTWRSFVSSIRRICRSRRGAACHIG
jgi:hypothetical protein